MEEFKISATVKADILAAAQMGVDLESLAHYARVPKRVMLKWVARYEELEYLVGCGEELETTEDQELYDLFSLCTMYRARLEVGAMMKIVEDANRGSGAAAKWILEKRFSDKYGKDGTTRIEISPGSTVSPPGEYDHLAEILATNIEGSKDRQLKVASDPYIDVDEDDDE